MSDHPVKPPPIPQDNVPDTWMETPKDSPYRITATADVNRSPQKPQKRDWTFSEFCHAATLAVVFGILVLLCVTTRRDEGRYQKAVRDLEAVRERVNAAQREYEAGVGRIMGARPESGVDNP